MGVNKDINTMMCLDIYLSSLNNEEYDTIRHTIKSVRTLPLISWDISAARLHKTANEIQNPEKLKLSQLAIKHLWKIDIESVLEPDYQAVVITNANSEICWASTGFTAMTGYAVSYAMGRNPNFLQGKNTSSKTKKKIRQCLKAGKPFHGTIINYRKNNEQYLCEVKIMPLINFNDQITHFIALEREAV